jgi:hypothetical protein
MEVLDGSQPFCVEIVNVYPPDWFASDAMEISRQMIERGAVRALEGTGKAACIRVRDVVIQPVDRKPRYVEEYTFRTLRRVLGGIC